MVNAAILHDLFSSCEYLKRCDQKVKTSITGSVFYLEGVMEIFAWWFIGSVIVSPIVGIFISRGEK